MIEVGDAYDVFADAPTSHALTVVLSAQPVEGERVEATRTAVPAHH